jgi:hypothetical protein
MSKIKQSLLESVSQIPKAVKAISLFFTGTINQSFILKTLLKETNFNINIYCPNQILMTFKQN